MSRCSSREAQRCRRKGVTKMAGLYREEQQLNPLGWRVQRGGGVRGENTSQEGPVTETEGCRENLEAMSTLIC